MKNYGKPKLKVSKSLDVVLMLGDLGTRTSIRKRGNVKRNEFDHIEAPRGGNIKVVRSLRGKDADSYHFLVKARFRI